MRSKRLWFAAIPVIVGAVPLAACGGSEKSTPSGSNDAGGASSDDAVSHDSPDTGDSAPPIGQDGGDATPDGGDATPDGGDATRDGGETTMLDGALNGDGTLLPDGDGGACVLDHTYSFGLDGGLVAFSDSSTLSPPAAFSLTRTRYGGDAGPTSRTCMAMLTCEEGDASPPSLGPVLADFRAAAVQAALSAGDAAAPVLFGFDQRPSDGAVFVIRRDDGRAFAVGSPCGGQPGCVPIPPAVDALVADLKALVLEELATAACSNL